MSKKDILKFSKTLLDQPINLTRKRIVRNNKLALESLPKPLEPTPYVAPKPKPKQRKLRTPVSLPRNRLPKKVDKKVKKLIDEISP